MTGYVDSPFRIPLVPGKATLHGQKRNCMHYVPYTVHQIGTLGGQLATGRRSRGYFHSPVTAKLVPGRVGNVPPARCPKHLDNTVTKTYTIHILTRSRSLHTALQVPVPN